MLLGTRTSVLALVVVIVAVSFAAAGNGTAPVAVATPEAGPVSASSLSLGYLDPADGATINTSTPTITVALAPGPATVVAADLHLDGMNLTSAGTLQGNAFVLPLALSLRNGPHVANYTAFDSLGGLTFVNWTFTVDTIPPLLLVTAPAYPMVPTSLVLVEGTAVLVNYALFPGAAPINVTATVLPSGVKRWAYPVAGPFSIPVPLTEGVNTIFVNATDHVGNFATQIVNVVSDTVKPPLVVLTPANLSVSPTDLVRVSGLSEFGAYLSVNGFSVTVAPNGTWSIVLALPEGLNILQIAAADQVGNLNYTGLAVFVDSDVPQITLTSPTATVSSQSRVVVAGTVRDTKLVALLVNGLPVPVQPAGKPPAPRKPAAFVKQDTKLGRQLAVYRSRPLGWRDAYIILLPGLLGVLAPYSYAVWLYEQSMRQHGPVAAEQWSKPWFWLAWGALAAFILLLILRFLDLRRFAVVHARGIQLRPGVLRTHNLRWEQISGVALSMTQNVFLRSRGHTHLRAVIYPNLGGQIRLDERLHNLPELISRIKASLYPRMLPGMIADFRAGKWLYFGPLAVQAKALSLQQGEISWEQVENLQVKDGYLAVSWTEGQEPVRDKRIPIAKIPNLELLLQIIREGINV